MYVLHGPRGLPRCAKLVLTAVNSCYALQTQLQMVFSIHGLNLGVPKVSQNNGPMCTAEIEARFAMNDPNGCAMPI